MRALVRSMMRRAAGGAGSMVSQVTVSVVATVAAAAITSAYLEPGAPTKPSAAAAASGGTEPIDERFGKALLDAAFTADGVRARQAYPLEFGTVFGPSPGRPYTALAAAEWSVAPAAEAAPARRPKPAAMAALPPQRPVPAAETPAAEPASAAADDRARVFGVALPGFVPRGETVVKTVAGWGDRVAGLVDIF